MNHKYENIILWWFLPGIAIIPISFLIANRVSLDFNNDSFTKFITFIWSSISLFGLYFLTQYLVSNLFTLFTSKKRHKKNLVISKDTHPSLAESASDIVQSENSDTCKMSINTGCQNIGQIVLPENIEFIVKTA